jgi:hypothetical protein
MNEPHSFSFAAKLEFSHGTHCGSDETTIQHLLAGCATVRTAVRSEERRGIDYVATLRRGAQVNVDKKARERGCHRWWRNGPDLALEVWSVVPPKWRQFGDSTAGGVTGWTLNEAKDTDLVLFTYDPDDTSVCFLLPFQPLRLAFRRFLPTWWEVYRHATQHTQEGDYHSMCLFVPAHVVLDALRTVSIAVLAA